MSVKTKDEIMSTLKERFKDDTSDDTLSFIEDISDTYDDMSQQVQKSGEWKQKYEDNDKEWRQRYHDRFFSNPDPEETDPFNGGNGDDEKPMTFEDLFKVEKGK